MSTNRSHSPSTKAHSKRSGSLSKPKLEARTNDLLRSIKDLEERVFLLEQRIQTLTNLLVPYPRPFPHIRIAGYQAGNVTIKERKGIGV